MLDSILKENTLKSYSSSEIVQQLKNDAERGDFFSVYNYLEQNLGYFKDKELKDVKIIGEKGIEDSLRFAMIDAERGIVSRMNEYLELASKYSNLFDLDISEKLKEIEIIGNNNRVIPKNNNHKYKKRGIIRIAGYADL